MLGGTREEEEEEPALLACWHLFRQSIRKSGILCTWSVVAFGLALSF